MWKTCFDDTDEFIDLYFSEKYKNENTLVYMQGNEVVASLQMLPYQFTFYGDEIPIAYISGACTLPTFRGKGLMSKLLIEAFSLMQKGNIPLSVLIPAEKWLYDYYSRYGYEKVFDEDSIEIPLKKLLVEAKDDVGTAYSLFDQRYQQQDFCIQKTKSDFITIVKDAEIDNFPPKTNLSGMARIIDVSVLLSYFAQKNPNKSFTINIKDSLLEYNNNIYQIENGNVSISHNETNSFSCTINEVCKLILGYRLNDFPPKISANFESQKPIMNLMLE